MTARDDTLRAIAAQTLQPAELLAAYRGDPVAPAVDRGHRGVLRSIPWCSWMVRGDVVELEAWEGLTEVVALAELHQLAATAGTPAKAARLVAALADNDRAYKDAERYLRKRERGADGEPAPWSRPTGPVWDALSVRMSAVANARGGWWSDAPPEPVDVAVGDQYDLFAEVMG